MKSLLELNEGQQEVMEWASRVIRDRIQTLAQEVEETAEFPEALLRGLGKDGLLTLPIPKEHGGSGVDFVSYLGILEEIAKVSGAISATLDVHTTCVARPILRFGSEEQKRLFLPRLGSGEVLGAFAATEPSGGSDLAGIQTTAAKHGAEFILNGEKALIANANHADLFVVSAKTAPERGILGVSVFLLDRGMPGFRPSGRREQTMGMRGVDVGGLLMEDVRVPADRLLGRENLGMKVLHETLVEDRMGTASIALGLAEAALAHSIRYARERRQSGQPISRFQSVKNILADMEVRISATRLLVREAATQKDSGEDSTLIASVAKLFASETAMRVAKDAIQVFGGWGYLKDYPVERLLRDAKHTEIVDGTSEIQRLLIADEVLKRHT